MKSIMKRVSCGRKSRYLITLYRREEIFNQGRKYTVVEMQNTFHPAASESNIHVCTQTPTHFPELDLLGFSVV